MVRRTLVQHLIVAVLVMSTVLVVAPSPAIAASAWDADAALVVTRLETDPNGNPVAVHLAWPEPIVAVDEFRIYRAGVYLDTVTGEVNTYTDTKVADVGALAMRHQVAAVAAGSELQRFDLPIEFPLGSLGCTRVWTGTAGPSWHDTRNWASVGMGPGEPGVPTVGDHACVTTTHNAGPIIVDQAGAVAKHLTSTGTAATAVGIQAREGGALTVADTIRFAAITLAGGTIDLSGGGELLAQAPLYLAGGTLRAGATVRATNPAGSTNTPALRADPNAVTTLAGPGGLEIPRVAFDNNAPTHVVGSDGFVLTAAERVYLRDAVTFEAASPGGATLRTPNLATPFNATSDTVVGWTLDGTAELQRISIEGSLEIADHAGLDAVGGDTVLDDVSIFLEGEITFREPLTGLAELDVYSGDLYSASGDEPFAGLRDVGDLTVRTGGTVRFDGDLGVQYLHLWDSTLEVNGSIVNSSVFTDGEEGFWGIVRNGEIRTRDEWVIPANASFDLGPDTVLDTDVRVEGGLYAVTAPDFWGPPNAVVNGDLTVATGGVLAVEADLNTWEDDEGEWFAEWAATDLAVNDTLTVEGIVTIEAGAGLPAEFERRLVYTPNHPPVGEHIQLEVTGPGADWAVAAIRTDGVYLTGDGTGPVRPEWHPTDRLQVAAVTVDGAGEPAAVTLTWPPLTGEPDALAIYRAAPGEDFAEPYAYLDGGDLAWTDDAPAPAAQYLVATLVDEWPDVELGPVTVVHAAGGATCTIVWTDAVGDQAWHDPRNWAPYGVAGDLGAVRAPAAGDHACVTTGTATAGAIVDVAGPGAVAATLAGEYTVVRLDPFDDAPDTSLAVGGDVAVTRLIVGADAVASVDGDLTANYVGVAGALTVTDTIAHVGVADAIDPGARVDHGSVTATQWEIAADATLELAGASAISGVVDVDGTLIVEGAAAAAVEALTFGPAAHVRVVVDDAGAPPHVAASGQFALGGQLTVDLTAELAPGTEVALVSADTPFTGSFATIEVLGGTPGPTVDVGDRVISLVVPPSEQPGWDADAVIRVSGLVLDESGELESVSLAWPGAGGAPSAVEVWREVGGVASRVAELSNTAVAWTDAAPVAAAAYRVVAVDAGDVLGELGPVRVVAPPADMAGWCSLAFVWNVSDDSSGLTLFDWDAVANWAPMGVAGSASLTAGPRVPSASDDVCIAGADTSELVGVAGAAAARSVRGDGSSAVLLDGAAAGWSVTGSVSLDHLRMDGDAADRATVEVGGDLAVRLLWAMRGDVDVAGSIANTGNGSSLIEAAMITAGDGWTIPAGHTVYVADAIIDAPLDVAGTLHAQTAAALLDVVTIAGILSVAGGTALDFSTLITTDTTQWKLDVADPAAPPRIKISQATIRGDVTVDLAAELPIPTDTNLVVAVARTADEPTSLTLTGAATGAELISDAGGIRLVRTAPGWAAGEVVQVSSLVVDEAGALESVALEWPRAGGAPTFVRVWRYEDGVVTKMDQLPGNALGWVDATPVADSEYRVQAVGSGGTLGELGPARVVAPSTVPEPACSLAFVWNVSGAPPESEGFGWDLVANWAPVGVVGSASLATGPRVPSASDHVCIGGSGQIVRVDGSAVAASITGDSTVMMAGAEAGLAVTGSLTLGSVLAADSALSVGGDLSAGLLSVARSTVTVGGSLVSTGSVLIDSGTITVDDVWTVATGHTVWVAGESSIETTLDIAGRLIVYPGAELAGDEWTILPAGELVLRVSGTPGAPHVDLLDLTADGTITVEVGQALEPGTDLHLIAVAAAPTGTPTLALAGDAADPGPPAYLDDLALGYTPDGLHLVHTTAPVEECAPVPAVVGMEAGGCWRDEGDGTYTSDRTTIADHGAPSLGGVAFVPAVGTELTLVASPAALTSDGPVQIEIRTRVAGAFGMWQASEPALDWSLTGSPIALPAEHFLGAPIRAAALTPTATGTWQATFDLPLPGLFDGAVVPLAATIGADGRLSAPTGSVPALSVGVVGWATDVTIGSRNAVGEWQLTGDGVDGQVTIGSNGVEDGSVTVGNTDVGGLSDFGSLKFDFDPATGAWTAGRITLIEDGTGGLRNGSTIYLDALDLGLIDTRDGITITKQASGWALASVPAPTALLQQLDLAFAGGRLSLGTLRFGDLAPGNLTTPRIAHVGDWLPVGGLTVTYDEPTNTWIAAGFLDQPAVEFTGTLTLDGGRVSAGSLNIPNVDLGAFATLDLTLAVAGLTGNATTYSVSGTLRGEAFDGQPSATGSITFADGSVTAANLRLAALPIGELYTIDEFALAHVAGSPGAPAAWTVAGTVRGHAGQAKTNAADVSGDLVFTDGVLTAAALQMHDVPFGPAVVDELSFVLARDAASGPRESQFSVAGRVRGPEGRDHPDRAVLRAFGGSATLLDGRLTAFDVDLPYLAFGDLAYLADLSVSYAELPGGAEVTGSGTLVTSTADGASGSAASLAMVVADGTAQSLVVTADRLALAGVVAIDSFAATYQVAGATCPGLDPELDVAVYAVSGTVASGSGTGAVTGCVAIDGRHLAGAELAAERVSVGELLSVHDLVVTYQSGEEYAIPIGSTSVTTGTAVGRRSLFALTGQVVPATGAPISVTGSVTIADGGVEALLIDAARVPLSSTVALRNLRVELTKGMANDGQVATVLAVSGRADHDGGSTTLTGDLTYGPNGLTAADVNLGNVPFGPLVLEGFTFRYSSTGAGSGWALAARVTAPSGGVVIDVSGAATFADGRLMSAGLLVPAFTVGELMLLTDGAFTFARLADGSERWSGSARVGAAQATMALTFGSDGRLSAGSITAAQVGWGGLFNIDNLALSGAPNGSAFDWAVAGQMRIGAGRGGSLAGTLTLTDGRATAGTLTLTDIPILELAHVQTLTLTAVDRGADTAWEVAASVAVGEGNPVAGAGTFQWRNGALHAAELQLGNVPVGELFRIDNFRLTFQQGRVWAASGTVTDEDGTSTLGGNIQFFDGAAVAGSLNIANLQLGPIDLAQFNLSISATGQPGPAACGVADTTGAGTRYQVAATVRTRDGATSSLAGRLRLHGGNFAEGVLCANNIKIADFVTLDNVHLAYSDITGANGRTISFTGSAAASNPSTGGLSSASVAFSIRDRQLQTLAIDVAGIELGDFLKLSGLNFSYDRTEHATRWQLGATVAQDGADATLAGWLTVDDGTIVGGSLQATEIRFGDLFVLEEFELSYHGREIGAGTAGNVTAASTNDCAATPTGTNVPSGISRGQGAHSRFTVSARVRANGDTFAARGSLRFGNGDLTGFDITLACLPIGEFKTLEGVRLAKRPGQLEFAGRLQDEDGTSGASGSFVFDDGRLIGGQVEMRQVPIGPVQLHRLRVAIGQTATGNTEYGLTVVLAAGDNSPVGAGGSLLMNDGKIVGGSLNLSGIKLFDLFTIDDLTLSVDASQPGRTTFAAGLGVSIGSGSGPGRRTGGHLGAGTLLSGQGGSVHVALTSSEGKLVAGSFEIAAVELFDVIPLGRVTASFDGVNKRWSAGLEMQIGQSGPAFVIAAEIQRGRLVSGTLGFDVNGDGQPDGAPGQQPPANGNAQMSWFPLKAMYVTYCSAQATAWYCPGDGVSKWAGRIGIELPTDAAPKIDVEIEVTDGVLTHAHGVVGLGMPGLPVYPAVFLRELGLGFGVKPFHADGSIKLGIGVPPATLATIYGWVSAGEGPPLAPGQSPNDYEADYIYFAAGGDVRLFDLPIGGEFVSVFQSNGYVGFGGQVTVQIVKKVLRINGGIEGAVFNASGQGMNLIDPETGSALTGWHAQAHGWVRATILGWDVASAEGYLNSIGAHGKASVGTPFGSACVGVGIYWSTGKFKPTCDVGQYAIAGVNVFDNPHLNQFAKLLPQALGGGQSYEYSEFDVAPDEEILAVTANGHGSALDDDAPSPDVRLIAPSGTVYDAEVANPRSGAMVGAGPNGKMFIVFRPEPGTWRLEAQPGSIPIAEVSLGRKLPPVQVGGGIISGPLDPSPPAGGPPAGGRLNKVVGDGRVTFAYDIAEIPGQQVLLFERSVGGTDTFAAPVATVAGGTGQITFTPSGGRSGGTRELVADVMHDGFTREQVVLGSYEVGEGRGAGPARNVAVTEIGAGARVTWAPPADDGGRRITSYRVYSDAGWDVTVAADATSVDLPIPAMVPGKRVAVYVEARNGLGWGESGMAAFTAAQTTGWQYEPYQVPTTDRPDLGGGLLTSPASDLVTGIDSGGDRVITPVAELPTSGGQAAVIVRWALLALGVGVALLAASRRGWPVAGGGGLGRSR